MKKNHWNTAALVAALPKNIIVTVKPPSSPFKTERIILKLKGVKDFYQIDADVCDLKTPPATAPSFDPSNVEVYHANFTKFSTWPLGKHAEEYGRLVNMCGDIFVAWQKAGIPTFSRATYSTEPSTLRAKAAIKLISMAAQNGTLRKAAAKQE